MEFFGPVVLQNIENILGPDSSMFVPLKENQVSIVHYPDCQQLIIWLNYPGSEYSMIRWFDEKRKNLEEYPVSDRLNGSIQLIWDTLPFAPGKYAIEIDWKQECKHIIHIEKKTESLPIEESQAINKSIVEPIAPVIESSGADYIVYKDGFGNVIPNEDLILREKLIGELTNRFSRRLEFRGNFRSGYITYIEGDTRIEFIHEMGGGGCAFYIEIPTVTNWEKETGHPLNKRDQILQFMAEQIYAKENKHFTYQILDASINFYQV
ncbi:MAG: hypothetical protein ABI761_03620 [Saprospiraceae bacterium]